MFCEGLETRKGSKIVVVDTPGFGVMILALKADQDGNWTESRDLALSNEATDLLLELLERRKRQVEEK